MARIRSIKPDYWSSGKQLRVSADAALLNIALWGRADDEGRMNDDEMEIGACCPRFCGKITALLRELEKIRFLHRYEVDGKRYIQIHDWKDHQRISKPRPSSIPAMSSSDTGKLRERSATIPGTLPERSTGKGSGSGSGREGSGLEGVYSPAQTKTKYAEFVYMTPEEHGKLVAQFGEQKAERMIVILNNYKGANGKKYKSDYLAILNWVVKRLAEDEKNGHTDQPAGAAKPGRYAHLTRWGKGKGPGGAAAQAGK